MAYDFLGLATPEKLSQLKALLDAEVAKTDDKISAINGRIARMRTKIASLELEAGVAGVPVPPNYDKIPKNTDKPLPPVVVDSQLGIPVYEMKEPIFDVLRSKEHIQHRIRRLYYRITKDEQLIQGLTRLRDELETRMAEAQGVASDETYVKQIQPALVPLREDIETSE